MKTVSALAIVLLLAACKGGDEDIAPPPCPGCTFDNSGAIMYVLNQASDENSLLRFPLASGVDGDVAPAARILVSGNPINQGRFIFWDTGADEMYIANQGSDNILVIAGVSTLASGSVAPSRVITSTSFDEIVSVVVVNNRMYVTDQAADSIYIFNNASGLVTGSYVPDASIQGFPVFSSPQGLYLDSSSGYLYLCDKGNDAIKIFFNAGALVTDPLKVADVTVTSANLDGPVSMDRDRAGNFVVASQANNSILVFQNNSNFTAVGGSITPLATLSWSSSPPLNSPYQIAGYSDGNAIFVANGLAKNVISFAPFTAYTGPVSPSPATTLLSTSTTHLSTTVSGQPTAVGIAIKP